MSNVVPFLQPAEREYEEYVRLVGVMNNDLTFENARSAAKQWHRFMNAYDEPRNDAALGSVALEPLKL